MASQKQMAVTIDSLSLYYGNHKALDNINLSLPLGSRAALVGPNGAGKSTLVKAILGLETFQEGSIQLFQEKEDSQKALQKRLAYVPQSSQVNWQFPATVFEIVLMGRYPYIQNFLKIPSKIDKQLALESLEKMGLLAVKDQPLMSLSGGQKQRVFMARALVQEADFFLLDEPLASVDVLSEAVIMDTLQTLQKNGKTSLVIHHDLQTLPDYFDYLIWLNKGVVAHGNMQMVFTEDHYRQTYQANPQSFPYQQKK